MKRLKTTHTKNRMIETLDRRLHLLAWSAGYAEAALAWAPAGYPDRPALDNKYSRANTRLNALITLLYDLGFDPEAVRLATCASRAEGNSDFVVYAEEGAQPMPLLAKAAQRRADVTGTTAVVAVPLGRGVDAGFTADTFSFNTLYGGVALHKVIERFQPAGQPATPGEGNADIALPKGFTND